MLVAEYQQSDSIRREAHRRTQPEPERTFAPSAMWKFFYGLNDAIEARAAVVLAG